MAGVLHWVLVLHLVQAMRYDRTTLVHGACSPVSGWPLGDLWTTVLFTLLTSQNSKEQTPGKKLSGEIRPKRNNPHVPLPQNACCWLLPSVSEEHVRMLISPINIQFQPQSLRLLGETGPP